MSKDDDYTFGDDLESDNQGLDDEFSFQDDTDSFDSESDDIGAMDEYESDNDDNTFLDDTANESEPPVQEKSSKSPVQNQPSSESYQEKKPFLKTPLGQAVVAAGVLCLGVAGYSAYSVLKPQVPQYIPEELDPTPPVAKQVDFGSFGQPEESLSAQVIQDEGFVPNKSPQLFESEAVPDNDVFSMSVDANVIPKIDEIIDMMNADRDQIRSVINSLKAAQTSIDNLNRDMRSNEAEYKKVAQAIGRIEESLKAQPVIEVKETVVAKAGVAIKPVPVKLDPIIGDRKRLADLKVVDVSQTGDMSIIQKVSDGRIFTLFKGEVLITSEGRLMVDSIEKDGQIVLVGKGHYIDKTDPPVRAVVRAEPARPAVRKAPEAPKAPVFVTNYTLNAVFDSGNAFGLVDGNGDFKTYKRGDTLPGVGKIEGLSTAGDLRVGGKLVKPVY